jgi:hypothetical protein
VSIRRDKVTTYQWRNNNTNAWRREKGKKRRKKGSKKGVPPSLDDALKA